ncbi:MAG: TfoX/Sxy family protein [Acidobacteria bacterium]|nr:TfoX/Sxy family protein [Acidobacteriota bacterium]
MAYDEKLAHRIRQALAESGGIAEMRMMGGLCFTLHGNMLCGVLKSDLVVRVGSERYEDLLAQPHARPMDFTGRPIRGFVFVGPGGYRTGRMLRQWLDRAAEFASSLPEKTKKQRRQI